MFPRSKSITKKARNIRVKTCHSWSVHEKLMVIHYFECVQNIAATTRKFDIEHKQVHDWSKDDLVFNYEILSDESANMNEEEALNFDNNNDEYEEIRVDNDWE
ncbi:35119_t:CDS:2 [Gigaspora margarita]|uniref:35119_t:CDS:1 n=1 Tax=Gigaspora margarita TaxID=4874 RepID=A0ABN7UKM5_GIGMA|nr:35119_t:CDS:2 [Gigaspora margarita]